ncbi:CmcJ/NvfI family oxidoreductase, partial [Streptococcus pyogenes]|uniref:CmcJ/NvfI family oxidoreductase n=1 Tax=Streptococcus pyogenes TaxID=1314 RepID=UPI003DA076C8
MLEEADALAVLRGSDSPQAKDVVAPLSYVQPRADMPVSYAYEPPPGVPWESADFSNINVLISDARASDARASLHRAGFELIDAPTKVRDFDNRDAVQLVYYDEVLEIALAATGASYGFVFDHLVRRRDPKQQTLSFGRKVRGQPPSANGRIHNDYTEASGKKRLRLVLGDGEPAESIHRYCIVNVWRPIAYPAIDAPLALCDARTVSASDGVVSEVRYPGRIGEIFLFKHSPLH